MALVLIVEDDTDLRHVLDFNLKREGFETRLTTRGAEALRAIRERPPDLVLLDVMLPDLSGTDVCRQLKAEPSTAGIPVILLTARAEEVDRINGFEIGADDFVAKPFSLRELILRIRAILRRAAPAATGREVLSAGAFRIDLAGHRLQVDGVDVPSTLTELRILAQLVAGRGKVISRERLHSAARAESEDVSGRAIDTHIKRLRDKLGPHAAEIETVRGVGYRFRDA